MTIRKLPDTGPKTGEGNPEAEQGNITLAPAGLPSRNPTKSYWLREPEESLLGYRGTADLPETADVVVVGSGITGAFAARFLLEAGGGDGRVVMLEAREACAGATGRVSLSSFSFVFSSFWGLRGLLGWGRCLDRGLG